MDCVGFVPRRVESENPSGFLPSRSFHGALMTNTFISIEFDHLKSGYEKNTNK
jgi:hypothetical protein